MQIIQMKSLLGAEVLGIDVGATISIMDQALPIAGFDNSNLPIISLSRNSPPGNLRHRQFFI